MTLSLRQTEPGLVTVKVSGLDGAYSEHIEPDQARNAAEKLELLADQTEEA